MKLSRNIFEKVHKQLSNISLGVCALLLLRPFPSYDEILGCLNTYSPFITAMAAVASVIVSAFLVVVTLKYVKLTRELLNENIKARDFEIILKIKDYPEKKKDELKDLSSSIKTKRSFQDLPIPKFDMGGSSPLKKLMVRYRDSNININIKVFNDKIDELKSCEEKFNKKLDENSGGFKNDIVVFFSGSLELNSDGIDEIIGFVKECIKKNTESLAVNVPDDKFWNSKRLGYLQQYEKEIASLDESRKNANDAIDVLIQKFNEIIEKIEEEYGI